MNAESGKVLFSYHDSSSLVPASCLKIATTGAALGLLGTCHRFKTKIFYNGNIDESGTLHGDIVIFGGGDPTFGSERWGTNVMSSEVVQMRNKIIAKGINKIDGKLIVDLAYFDNEYCCRSWACDDTGNYFGAGASAFNINENKYDIKLQPGTQPGTNVKIISCSPEQLHLHFVNHLVTGELHSGDQSNIYPGKNDSSMVLEGSVQPSKSTFTIKGAIPNPPAFAAAYIAGDFYYSGMLRNKTDWQINCGGAINVYKSLKIIDSSFESPDLINIVRYTNLNSINLYAECILKETGKVIKGSGTRQSGIMAIKIYWYDHGIDTSGLYMDDGCGLSRSDKITALQLCEIQSVIEKKPYFQQFLNSLPVSGKSGAMKTMGKGTGIEGKLYAKTGHMERARAYCGYIKSPSGKWICFSLLVNNYSSSSSEIHDAIEKLLVALAKVDD